MPEAPKAPQAPVPEEAAPEGELPTGWTPEQLAHAEQELKSLTPEDWLIVQSTMADYDDLEANPIPEAPVIVFTDFVSKKGTRFSVTVRAKTIPQAFAHFANGIPIVNHLYGVQPVSDETMRGAFSPKPSTPAAPAGAPAAPQVSAPQAPGAPSAPSEPVYTSEGAQDNVVEERGTDVLNSIQIDVDGKIKFSVGKFRYPFQDSRGADAVAALFDPALGWTAAHFANTGGYTPANWGGTLKVDWEKVKKNTGKSYYNVLKIHA